MSKSKLRERVFLALGEASMCWDPLPSGVFDSTKAQEIGDRLVSTIAEDQPALEQDKRTCEYQEWDTKDCTAKSCPYTASRGTDSDGICFPHAPLIKDGKELPKGRTCRSCTHTVKCKQLGVYNPDSVICDWDPCRYAEYHGDMTPEPLFMHEICEALGCQGGTVHDALEEIKRLKLLDCPSAKQEDKAAEGLIDFAKDVRDNWDHDGDAHKYGTPCRCCEAEKALTRYQGGK